MVVAQNMSVSRKLMTTVTRKYFANNGDRQTACWKYYYCSQPLLLAANTDTQTQHQIAVNIWRHCYSNHTQPTCMPQSDEQCHCGGPAVLEISSGGVRPMFNRNSADHRDQKKMLFQGVRHAATASTLPATLWLLKHWDGFQLLATWSDKDHSRSVKCLKTDSHKPVSQHNGAVHN